MPSYEQGFGFPVLDDALYFPGDRSKLFAVEAKVFSSTQIHVAAGTPLKAVLVWTDPPGSTLVKDLDLRVAGPNGEVHYGNEVLHPAQRDTVNNVEAITIGTPVAGTYSVSVDSASVPTGVQSYALVVTGDISTSAATATTKRRSARH